MKKNRKILVLILLFLIVGGGFYFFPNLSWLYYALACATLLAVSAFAFTESYLEGFFYMAFTSVFFIEVVKDTHSTWNATGWNLAGTVCWLYILIYLLFLKKR